MKKIRSVLIIYFLFLFSSCATGLVAVHNQFPYICFLKGCRAGQKMECKRTKLMSRKKSHGSRGKRKKMGGNAIIVKQDLKNKKKKSSTAQSTVSIK